MEKIRQALTWALGRIGQRVPVYGPLNTVVPAEKAAQWLEKLMQVEVNNPVQYLAAMQLARRTDDRYRDLPENLRDGATSWMAKHAARRHLIELVRDGGTLDVEEQKEVFGEALPKGLRIQ